MNTPHPFASESAVDMAFRPEHYSDFLNPVETMINGISGQMRRDRTRTRLAEDIMIGVFDSFCGADAHPPLEEKADKEYVLAMNRDYGPHWLGVEYLPDLKAGEIEIARVVLASVLLDVFSIRARWSGGRYHYRILDEYGTKIAHVRKTSKRTLTLGQLVELLDSAEGVEITPRGLGLVELWWERQLEFGEPPKKCTQFARAESEIYQELRRYYQLRVASVLPTESTGMGGGEGEGRGGGRMNPEMVDGGDSVAFTSNSTPSARRPLPINLR